MATLLHSESRRLYSWWWDSHISPKNSKWLQENLTDMDAKVKVMIKLIEEDADSFARRAEMYYKKRPELMKLVEEFYRAYRALAERYDHATGELRQAHKTMAETFPNQAPFVLADDSPSGSVHGTEPHTPEMAHPVRAPSDPDDLQKDALGISASDLHLFKRNGCFSGDSDGVISKRGLKQLYEIEVEIEVQNLKKALTDMQTEKEAVLFKYQQSLEKLSSLEGELFCAENDSRRLNEKAIKAESEFLNLKQAISKLEAERDAGFIKNKDCSERISNLEVMVLRAQKDAKGLDERAIKAETEAQCLKNELLRLETEKESGLLQYKQCLEKISVLEKKVFSAEEDARHLTQKAERAETEVEKLELILLEVTAQKEAGDLQYKLCLEKISKLESEISCAQEDIRGLNSEILMGAKKLRTAEGKCDLLEMSNQTLRLEVDNLIKKIMVKDKELSEKHGELEKLEVCVHDERSRYHEVEATLSTLQNMYSQSQEDHRNLELELKNGLQMLRVMELCKHGLEEEIQEMKGENQSLNELNSSSTISIRDLQNEILGLTKMKERLEEEVSLQLGRSNTLQQEIGCLKEEINGLNGSYEALIKQVELVGLNPKCIGTSVKELQDENSRLKQVREQDKYEKETLFKKVVNMEELLKKNAVLESSLSDVNGELEESKEKAKLLQESCNILHEEKSSVVGEKAVLLSQLQIITENMQKLLEKNNVLENSLCSANVELEGLRGQSKRLAELCHLFGDEKANLLTERSALAGQLETVEQRLVDLQKRYVEFEKKYAGLEKEKESTHLQLEELRVSFELEKQERATLIQRSESQLVSLNSQIHLLQEENRWRKKEFLEELDKAAISQFEIFILQKFVEDMEEKNYSILMECQKQMDASKLADKLISELKNENFEQHVEVEILLVEVEKLRLGISQVFKSLEIGPHSGSEEEIEKVQIFVHHILEDIVNMKNSLLKYTDDNHQLIVENSLLLTLLGQSKLEGLEVESEKNNLGRAFRTMKERILMMETEKNELLEMNRQLRSEVSMGSHHANMLMAEVESLKEKQAGMQSDYLKLQEEYSQTLEENRSLLKQFSDLEEEKCLVEEESNEILLEMLTCSNLSKILESARTEDAVELKLLSKDVHELHGVNNELEKEVKTLRENLGMNESESSNMKDLVEKLEMELSGVKDLNCKLKNEISSKEDFLSCKIKELSDAKQKHITTGNLNSELCITVEGLKLQSENLELVKENLKVQIFKLSEDNTNQKKEIEYLLEVTGNLEYELGNLNGEIEKRRILEENMNSELQERRNEFELWDAEAATFYFDLQLSTIGEVLFEDKVRELTGVCQSLQDENASKTEEIEQMKERISSQESEIGGLQCQILAYAPAIASLRDSVESLEHNTLSRAKLVVADYQIPKDVEVEVHASEKSYQELVVNQNSPIPNEILDLQNRIKTVEKVLVEEVNKLQESSIANAKNGILPEAKNGILMKDIPLDQVSDSSLHRGSSRADDPMLVLWETSDDNHSIEDDIIFNQFEDAGQRNKNPCSELEIEELGVVDKLQLSTSSISSMNEAGNKKKILERLASDGGKLANIQTSVQILRRKLESDKKSRKGKNIDLETVKEQLQEAEETAVQLFDLNGQMTKKIEEIPFFSYGKGFSELDVQKKKVSEQARKESEKIGRLQLEVQKIQYMLQKVENEKKRNGKIGFPSSNRGTTMILRNFINSGSKRSSGRKNNGRFCGCFKPSTSGEE